MYIEDDQITTWGGLLSWAMDTEVLSKKGFQQAFFRTEVALDTGEDMMLDFRGPTSVSESFTLHLSSADNMTSVKLRTYFGGTVEV